jgi:hypothetical protein
MHAPLPRWRLELTIAILLLLATVLLTLGSALYRWTNWQSCQALLAEKVNSGFTFTQPAKTRSPAGPGSQKTDAQRGRRKTAPRSLRSKPRPENAFMLDSSPESSSIFIQR